MRLHARYAIYLSSALLAGALLMVCMVAMQLFMDGDQYRQRLQNDLKLHLIIDQQQSLVSTAVYLSRRLAGPLERFDLDELKREIGEVGIFLPIRRFEITDPDGVLLTDGSSANAQRGKHIDDQRIGRFDLSTPHVLQLSGR
ncbi:MAG: hypothetical protein QM739_21305 [Propionivibrio sp.]